MIIESLNIIDYIDKKGTSYRFSDGANLILSSDSEKGKSSLLKSIYYTLGFDIRQFPEGWNVASKVFQLKFKTKDNTSHTVQRQGDIFKVDNQNTPLNSKEYSIWFQDVLGIDLKLTNTKSQKLNKAYSTAVILPFYIDQDDSWDGALYRRVSDTLGQYSEAAKGIFEYLFSISDIESQKLKSEINSYKELIKDNDIAIKNLTKVLTGYIEDNLNITEIPKIDKNELNAEINYYLNLVNEYSIKAGDYKIKLINLREKLDFYQQDYIELSNLLKMNKKRYKDIENECKYCHSKLTQEQSLTRMGLNNNQFEIIILKDKISKNIENIEEKIFQLQSQQIEIEDMITSINTKIKSSKELLTIDDYVNAKARTVAVREMEKNVEREKLSRIDSENKKKEKESERRKLLKEKGELKEKIISCFENFKNDVEVSLRLSNTSDSNFLQFKKINGSGMNKNTKYLSEYLIYFLLIEKFGVYKIPFCMDSFIKNEISHDKASLLFAAIEKYFLSLESQVFFSIITDNLVHLDDTENYNIVNVEEHLLLEENYEPLSAAMLLSNT